MACNFLKTGYYCGKLHSYEETLFLVDKGSFYRLYPHLMYILGLFCPQRN